MIGPTTLPEEDHNFALEEADVITIINTQKRNKASCNAYIYITYTAVELQGSRYPSLKEEKK